MRWIVIVLLTGCVMRSEPFEPCDWDAVTEWHDQFGPHFTHEAWSVKLVNATEYPFDLHEWNDLDMGIRVEEYPSAGSQFSIHVVSKRMKNRVGSTHIHHDGWHHFEGATIELDPDDLLTDVMVEYATCHELGHALGLPHAEDDPDSCLSKCDNDECRRRASAPSRSDARKLRELYGHADPLSCPELLR